MDKRYDNFVFYKSWWEIIKTLPADDIREIIDTLCRYVFEGTEPTFSTMSPVSMAVRFMIKDIDAVKDKHEDICKKRSEAGKAGALQRAAKQANDKFDKQIKQMPNLPNKAKQIKQSQANQAEDKIREEKIREDKNNNNNNIIGSCAHEHTCTREEEASEVEDGKVRVRKWILDNEEATSVLLRRLQLITTPVSSEEAQRILEPYIDEFYGQLLISGRDDIDSIGRMEIKRHFASWLRKYIEIAKQNQDNNGNTNRRGYRTSGTRDGLSYEEFARQFSIGWNSGVAHRGE